MDLFRFAVDFTFVIPSDGREMGMTVVLLAPDIASARLWAAGFVSGVYEMIKLEIIGCEMMLAPSFHPGLYATDSRNKSTNG